VVRFVDGWVLIQPGVRHEAINKIIDDTRDAVNSAEAFAEAGFVWLCWHVCLRSSRELRRIILHLGSAMRLRAELTDVGLFLAKCGNRHSRVLKWSPNEALGSVAYSVA
jgi:hypothetical protein